MLRPIERFFMSLAAI